MEADCSDYLDKMSDMHFNGGMGFVFSAWDNQDRRVPLDFELDDMCGDKPMNTCDRAKNVISDFAVYQSGYTEDKPFDPTELLPFKADSDFYGPNAEFYLNGLPGQNLTATDRTITMGENNRAFVLDTQQDDSTYWAYYHQYIGGSVQFDVDVSAVMCDSVAGVYLAALDDDQCSWDVKAAGVKPNCQSIDLMEANIYGFAQAAHPDADCDHCKHREWGSSQGTMNYGPSRRAIINSMEPYNVKIQFYTDKYQGDLISIKTTMSQFDKVHEFSLECGEKFDAFKDTLSGQMGLAISSYHAGKDNEVGGPCPPSDNPKPTSVIGNIIWTENDSIMGTD